MASPASSRTPIVVAGATDPEYDVVIPTVARPSLSVLLTALARGEGPLPGAVIVVDDRPPAARRALQGRDLGDLSGRVMVVDGLARGPAAARNTGWRRSRSAWVAFLDDDVVPPRDWRARLAEDLTALPRAVGGSQGRISVPRPFGRPSTDWERNVAALEGARWATADMAYRREALERVGGFDERFPRAYREDADLALRVRRAGYALETGRRRVTHPVRPADPWVSLRMQEGNADDARMLLLHGRRWREFADAPRGRRPWHLAITASAAVALVSLAAQRPRLAAVSGLAWLGGTAELAWRRIAEGPKGPPEIVTMAVTSVAIPPLATFHWFRGLARGLLERSRTG
jgi:cellulose synthase/poly-beta-1,6-N-acetylglucosamine synthase-like glycosyltransferase